MRSCVLTGKRENSWTTGVFGLPNQLGDYIHPQARHGTARQGTSAPFWAAGGRRSVFKLTGNLEQPLGHSDCAPPTLSTSLP